MLATLLLLAPAQAGDLTYAWDESATLHYRIQGYVKAPRLLRFYHSENEDARVGEFTFGLKFACTVGNKKKKTVAMVCDVHQAQFAGYAFEGEQYKLNNIFEEYKAILEDQATVELVWTHAGRLKHVDIEGLNTGDRRDSAIAEDLRQMMARAFSVLEVEMPKDGQDPGEVWQQKGSPRIFDLPSARQGTVGAKDFFHEVVGTEGTVLTVQHSGEGTVADGASMDAGIQSGGTAYTGAKNTISMFVSGTSTFDSARGVILTSEMSAQGMETASSSSLMRSGELYVDTFLLADLWDSWEALEAWEAADDAAPEEAPEEASAEDPPAAEEPEEAAEAAPVLDEEAERKEAPAAASDPQ